MRSIGNCTFRARFNATLSGHIKIERDANLEVALIGQMEALIMTTCKMEIPPTKVNYD